MPAYRGSLTPELIQLSPPLTADMLAPLDDQIAFVSLSKPFSDAEYRELGPWLARHPAVELAVGIHFEDLEFLRFFPTVQRFRAAAHSLTSFDGLRHLSDDVQAIDLGSTRKRLSLKPLARFTGLRRLSLEGHTKDIGVVSGLTGLGSLTLRSITLPDLTLLEPLNLRALDLKLGGTRNLTPLPPSLEYLELWQVKGLDDLGPIERLENLTFLFLQSLSRVTRLPVVNLETIWLQNLKGVRDLTPLLAAKDLQRVALIEMTQLEVEAVAVLARHPGLKHLQIAFPGRKKAALDALLPLTPGDFTAYDRPKILYTP